MCYKTTVSQLVVVHPWTAPVVYFRPVWLGVSSILKQSLSPSCKHHTLNSPPSALLLLLWLCRSITLQIWKKNSAARSLPTNSCSICVRRSKQKQWPHKSGQWESHEPRPRAAADNDWLLLLLRRKTDRQTEARLHLQTVPRVTGSCSSAQPRTFTHVWWVVVFSIHHTLYRKS